MEYLSTIREIVSTIGGAGTVVVLVILWQAGLLKMPGSKKEATETVPELIPDLSKMSLLVKKMDTLTQYFNHETTDLLRDIRNGVETMHEKQDRTNNTLEIIKVTGLPYRHDK